MKLLPRHGFRCTTFPGALILAQLTGTHEAARLVPYEVHWSLGERRHVWQETTQPRKPLPKPSCPSLGSRGGGRGGSSPRLDVDPLARAGLGKARTERGWGQNQDRGAQRAGVVCRPGGEATRQGSTVAMSGRIMGCLLM